MSIEQELESCLANDCAPDTFLVREAIDEIKRLRRCLFQMQEAAKDLVKKDEP